MVKFISSYRSHWVLLMPKIENKTELEACFVLNHLNQYIPCVQYLQQRLNGSGESIMEEKASFHKILICGDQLTSARTRSAIKIKANSETECKRLSAIIPVVEDWHSKVYFLRVSAHTGTPVF